MYVNKTKDSYNMVMKISSDLCESFKQFVKLHENCNVTKEKQHKPVNLSKRSTPNPLLSGNKQSQSDQKVLSNTVGLSPQVKSHTNKLVLNEIIDQNKEIYVKTPYGLMPLVMMNRQNEGPVIQDPRITFDNLSLHKLGDSPSKNLISDIDGKKQGGEQSNQIVNMDTLHPYAEKERFFFPASNKKEEERLDGFKQYSGNPIIIQEDLNISKEKMELEALKEKYQKKDQKQPQFQMTLKMKRKGDSKVAEIEGAKPLIAELTATTNDFKERVLIDNFLKQAEDIMSHKRKDFDYELVTRLKNTTANKNHFEKLMDLINSLKDEPKKPKPASKKQIDNMDKQPTLEIKRSEKSIRTKEKKSKSRSKSKKLKPKTTGFVEKRMKEKIKMNLNDDTVSYEDLRRNNKKQKKRQNKSPLQTPRGKIKVDKIRLASPSYSEENKNNTAGFNIFKNEVSNDSSINKELTIDERLKKNQYLY